MDKYNLSREEEIRILKTGAGAKLNSQKQKNKSKGQKKIKENAKSILEKNTETSFKINTTHSAE